MGTVWLARNREGCGEQRTKVCPADPGVLRQSGMWDCGGGWFTTADQIGLQEIPHGTKQEFTLTATPVPQPKRAKELWGLWHELHGWKWMGGNMVPLYATQHEAGLALKDCPYEGWKVRRYDTCEIDESLNPPS